MIVIGLTGGTATGKSTVAAIFASMGARIIDADEVARELVHPGSEALQEIAEVFGQGVVNEDGSLNRRALGRICFSERRQLLRLNSIMHPRIRSRVESLVEEIKRSCDSACDRDHSCAVVVDAAILYESGLDEIADVVIAAVADPGVQVQRLVQRSGLPEDEARARVAAQRSNDEFARLSDFVVDTTLGEESYSESVRVLYREILRDHRG